KVSIAGLSRADVLLNLYDHARFQGDFGSETQLIRMRANMRKPGDPNKAESLMDERLNSSDLYFDYVDLGKGRVQLQVDLSGSDFDTKLYNEMHGAGLAERVIEKIYLNLLQ